MDYLVHVLGWFSLLKWYFEKSFHLFYAPLRVKRNIAAAASSNFDIG